MISDKAAEIFLKARTLDVDTQEQFVNETCAGSAELRLEVKAMLSASNESEAYFEKLSGKVGLSSLADDDTLPVNKRIGSWRLLKQIGQGGMGAVYLAERADEQFEQQVALKILPTGLDSEQARARFLIERQILARLAHDNIARLLDGGVTEDGVPYFVMDYVDGLPVDEYCREHKLKVRDRLLLVLAVAEAVQFAHRNLIIHRDLKPSNVMVDSDGSVRLLDFGIAKMLYADPVNAQLTQEARRPATPAFASPEMLRGEPVDVTTDVYSIGALLYVLLTGNLPLEYDGLSVAEMYARASDSNPELLSHIDTAYKGDLDAIASKALAKLPAERYASVESLANDIRNYLNGQPVAAKTPSSLYRARKFVGRHRAGTAFAAFAVISLACIAGLATWSAVTTERQAQQIRLERDRAEQTKDFLISIFDAADPNIMPGDNTAREILEAGRERIEAELAEQPATQADLLAAMGSVYRSWRMVPEGRAVFRRVLELRESVDGQHSSSYIDVLQQLATMEEIGGDYAASLAVGQQALQLSTESRYLHGQAAGHERVGRISHLQGDYAAADTHFREALRLLIQQHGEDSLDVAFVREHLAALLTHQQDYIASLNEFEKSLAIRIKSVTGDSSEISPIYLGMGTALTSLGHLDEAFETYMTGYSMNDRLYGPGNSYNMYFANGLGKVANAQGDLDTAAARFNEARELILKHTPNSPNLAFATANVAKVYARQGQFEIAADYFAEAAGIYAEKLPQHWTYGDVKWRWGQCLARLGKLAEAKPLFQDGIRIIEAQWGNEHESAQEARAAAAEFNEAWEL